MGFVYAGFYNYLSTITDGACFWLTDCQPASISKVTIDVLLAWMGAEKAGADVTVELPAFFTGYISVENIKKIKDENDPVASSFFLTPE